MNTTYFFRHTEQPVIRKFSLDKLKKYKISGKFLGRKPCQVQLKPLHPCTWYTVSMNMTEHENRGRTLAQHFQNSEAITVKSITFLTPSAGFQIIRNLSKILKAQYLQEQNILFFRMLFRIYDRTGKPRTMFRAPLFGLDHDPI